LAFGEPFNALQTGEHHAWVLKIFQSLKIAVILSVVFAYTGPIIHTIIKNIPAAKREVEENFKFSEEKTNRRLAEETDRRDLMGYATS